MAVAFKRFWGLTAVGVVVCALLVVAMAPVSSVDAQNDDAFSRALANAQRWVKRELNRPDLILVEYTYEGTSWDSSAMGCPVPGQTYDAGTVHGYRWTFLFHNMVRYEVHTNLDGTMAVLCSSANTSPDVKLNQYSTTTFTILVPEAWIVYPNDDRTEVLFIPQQDVVCEQPGMRVMVRGRVASGVTPDQLLDDYLAEAGSGDEPSDRQTIGAFGRSTIFQTACGDMTRQWRVTMFVQYGTAYQVEQWSPVESYSEWETLFVDMLSGFAPNENVVGAGTVGGAAGDVPADNANGDTVAAPALAPLPLAHVFVGDVFLGALNDVPGRSITSVPTWERRHLAFSPDGLYLSFVNVTNAELRVLDVVNGRSPRRVGEAVETSFPPAWRADSAAIAYVTGAEDGPDGTTTYTIMQTDLTGADTREAARFTFAADCSAALDDPADRLYAAEAGRGGRERVLVWLPDGRFLVSTACSGGLAFVDPASGAVRSLGDDLLGGTYDPGGNWFAAATDSGLAVIDLASGVRANLSVGEGIRHLAWGTDGETVFFARETLADSIVLDDSADASRGQDVFGAWPVTVEINDLTVARLNVNTLDEEVLWEGQGRGIGTISPAPDGSGIAFSVVPSAQLLSEVFQAGADPYAVREAWPQPALYWRPADGDSAFLLAYAGQPVFAPVTVGIE